jgi:hypothetical protein
MSTGEPSALPRLWRILAGVGATDWVEAIDMPGAQVAVADYRPEPRDLQLLSFREFGRGAGIRWGCGRHGGAGGGRGHGEWVVGGVAAIALRAPRIGQRETGALSCGVAPCCRCPPQCRGAVGSVLGHGCAAVGVAGVLAGPATRARSTPAGGQRGVAGRGGVFTAFSPPGFP